MIHYICTGGCSGVSERPGNCEAASCFLHGQPLRRCDCEDGRHQPKTFLTAKKYSRLTGAIFGKIKTEWILRIALGVMFIYSGLDLFSHPENWVGYIPGWFKDSVGSIFGVETYLRFQGMGELAIGILFLAWFGGIWGMRIASILASFEILGILLFVGVDLITFRDIGLLGAALAMLVISFNKSSQKSGTVSAEN